MRIVYIFSQSHPSSAAMELVSVGLSCSLKNVAILFPGHSLFSSNSKISPYSKHTSSPITRYIATESDT